MNIENDTMLDQWVGKEQELERLDRLGLAYCRFYSGQWDNYIAPPPPGYQHMRKEEQLHLSWVVSRNLSEYLGSAETSRAWWKFVRGASDEEWLVWYMTTDHEPTQNTTKKLFRHNKPIKKSEAPL